MTAIVPAWTSGEIRSGGESIYFETSGLGEAVVLCHGGGGNHTSWYQQVPALAERYQVITWDQRGFGRSSNRGNQASPLTSSSDLAALLDHLGLDRCHLIGQSLGGWAVMGLAVAAPQRVRSLVLADTLAGVFTPAARDTLRDYLDQLSRATGPIQLGRNGALADAFLDQQPTQAFLYQQLASTAPSPPSTAVALLPDTSFSPELVARITAPTLFIVGEHDPIFPARHVHEIAALVSGARVAQIQGAGHSPYFEQANLWNQIVLNFLQGVS